MAKEMEPIEQLCYSTLRLECFDPQKPGKNSTGTSFIFQFDFDEQRSAPFLVTNRHVIDGFSHARFVMTASDGQGNPVIGKHVTVNLSDINQLFMPHPDPDVDLCAMPLAPLANEAKKQGKPTFCKTIGEDLVAKASDMTVMQQIVMVGYPIGLWDSRSNMPVFRRGVTATNPSIDYEGRREFLIDAACFPGSSGSPVFLHDDGGFVDRKSKKAMFGTRIQFAGVMYGGFEFAVNGELKAIPIPTGTNSKIVSTSCIPVNLGLVIKGERVLEFRQRFFPQPTPSQPQEPPTAPPNTGNS
jgi:hypothetical protein